MVKVTIALFEPDKARYNMGASQNILNAIPVADGVAPMPAPIDQNPAIAVLADEDGIPLVDEDGNVLIEITAGTFVPGVNELFLPEPPRGGIFIRLQSGSTRTFFGTETRLWEFDRAGNFWKDVSGPSAPYNCDDRWSFALYGDTVYCCNGADPEQKYDVNSDTAFSDNATAPIATDIAVVADFMMRALPDNSVQWSALNDPQTNTIGMALSDVQPFGDGNGVQRIIPVSSGAVIIQRDKVEILSYPDPDFVFRRSPVNGYRGSPAKWSACVIGQDDFVFYGTDGFFRGLAMQPIGAEIVDRFILEISDETARQDMISAPDFRRKIVWFRIQKTDGNYILLGYQWQLNRWCMSDVDLADMLRLETVGLTIGALTSTYATIGDFDIPWGSSIFDGGSVEFGGVTSDGYLAVLNGPPLEATIETNEASFNDVNRAFVNGGRVSGDIPTFSAVLSTADYKGATFVNRTAVTPSPRTRFIPFRGDGRVHKVTATIPAGESWTICQGFDLDVVGSGKS